jgi:hypothetical protein
MIHRPLLLTLALALPGAVSAQSSPTPARLQSIAVDRRAERPAAHSKLGNRATPTVSMMELSIALPQGVNSVSFDWYVDSEPGFDQLRVYAVGTPQTAWFTASGRNRKGRARLALPAGGAITLRVEYYKDISVDAGRDTARVDNLVIQSESAGALSAHRFDDQPIGATPKSWIGRGDTSTGWQISAAQPSMNLRRPVAQSFLGQSAASTSWISRAIPFSPNSTANSCAFDYLVSSEEGFDLLRAFVDGATTPAFIKSGHYAGRQTISLPPGGPHVLKFAFDKDASVDRYLDVARIDAVTCYSGGELVESHDFDGLAAGTVPEGWTTGGTRGGWSLAPPTPHATYVPMKNPKSVPGGREPTVDGIISGVRPTPRGLPREYYRPTHVPLPDPIGQTGVEGTLWLMESNDTESLYLAMRLPSQTPAAAGEAGRLTLLIDDRYDDTLKGRGCGPNGDLPRPEDRKVVISYQSGANSLATTSIAQYKGTCLTGAAAWSPLPAGSPEAFPVAAALQEPLQDDRGWLSAEVRIVLRPASSAPASSIPLSTTARLGLGLIHEKLAGTVATVTARLPYGDGNGPREDSVQTWERINLFEILDGSEVAFDGCCLAANR